MYHLILLYLENYIGFMVKGIDVGVPSEQFLCLQWKMDTLGLVVGDCCGGAIFETLQMLLARASQLHWEL